MTKIKTATLALATLALLSGFAALPQSAQAFTRGIAVGEFNPSRPRFEHFHHIQRFDRFDRFDRFRRGGRGFGWRW